jgi:hypothetical protein
MSEKLSYEEFVKQAILKLRTGDYKGIHTVYSGFNEAFRKYFDGVNPIEITNQLAKEKKIVIRPVKGGVMLYLPEEVPQSDKAEQVLKKMGLNKWESVVSIVRKQTDVFHCELRKIEQ